METNQKADVKK